MIQLDKLPLAPRPNKLEKLPDCLQEKTRHPTSLSSGRGHWEHKPREGVSIDRLMKGDRVWALLSKEIRQEVTEMGKKPEQANGELVLVRAWCRREGQENNGELSPN